MFGPHAPPSYSPNLLCSPFNQLRPRCFKNLRPLLDFLSLQPLQWALFKPLHASRTACRGPIPDVFLDSPVRTADVSSYRELPLILPLQMQYPQDPPSVSPSEATVKVVEVDYDPYGGEISLFVSRTERYLVGDSPTGARMEPRGGKTTLRPPTATVLLGSPWYSGFYVISHEVYTSPGSSAESPRATAGSPSRSSGPPPHYWPHHRSWRCVEGVATVCAQCLTASFIRQRTPSAKPPITWRRSATSASQQSARALLTAPPLCNKIYVFPVSPSSFPPFTFYSFIGIICSWQLVRIISLNEWFHTKPS